MLELNYHHLYYFFSVVKAGSIVNASDDLLLSPPTISAQIKKFERTVKRKLLEKKGQQFQLTPEGRIFFEYARQIFDLGDQLQDRIRDNRLEGSPAIQMGMTAGLPAAYAEAFVNFVHKNNSSTPVYVQELKLEKLLPMLADRRIDLLMSTASVRHTIGRHLECNLIGQFPLLVVGQKKKFGQKLVASELKNLPFVLATSPDLFCEDVRNYIELLGAKVLCEVPTREIALTLVSQGLGVTVLDALTYQKATSRSLLATFKPAADVGLSECVFITSIPRKLKNPVAEKVLSSFKLH